MSALAARLDAVIFDLDGTLIDSAADIAGALTAAFFAFDLPPVTRDQVARMIGDGAARLIDQAIAEVDGASPDRDQVYHSFLAHYTDWPVDRACAYPGMEAALNRLADQGIALGLCTNKPGRATENVLRRMGWDALFDAVLTGDRLPYRKPDGRTVTWVLGGLNSAPHRAVMIGDSQNDVGAGKAAGTATIVAAYGYPKGDPASFGADRLMARPEHLLGLLESLAQSNYPSN